MKNYKRRYLGSTTSVRGESTIVFTDMISFLESAYPTNPNMGPPGVSTHTMSSPGRIAADYDTSDGVSDRRRRRERALLKKDCSGWLT